MGDSSCFYCGAEATNKCQDCDGSISYCSSEHLKYHKSSQEPGGICLPYIVRRAEDGRGRYLVASRHIKPFETVIVDRSSGLGVFDDVNPVCLVCLEFLKEDSIRLCPDCRMPLCDKEQCQMSPRHQPECRILRNHAPEPITITIPEVGEKIIHPVYSLIGPLRLLRHKSDADQTLWRQIISLEGHLEQRRQDPRWEWVTKKVLPVAEACGLDHSQLTDLEQLFAIARTNCVTLYRVLDESPGYGCFPLFSLINHNCLANCRYDISTDNEVMTIRAARSIKAGEELSIQYSDPLLGNVISAAKFQDHWMFSCHCSRCSDPTELGTYLSAVRCPGQNCPGYILPENFIGRISSSGWDCSEKCGISSVAYTNVRLALEQLKLRVDKLSIKDPVSAWEETLNKLLTQLHPNHYLVMNVKRMMLQLLGTQVKFDAGHADTPMWVRKKFELCQEYLDVYGKVDPGYSLWYGRVMEEMATPFIIHQYFQLQSGALSKCQYLSSYKQSIAMLREAVKCRQYQPRSELDKLFAVYLRHFNNAIETFVV